MHLNRSREERWPFRFAHSVGELAQLTSNKTNKSVISPRATLDDNSAAVRATIATGNDKPPTIPSGEVTRRRLASRLREDSRSGLVRENAGDIRVSRRTLRRIERYNAGQATRVLRVMDH